MRQDILVWKGQKVSTDSYSYNTISVFNLLAETKVSQKGRVLQSRFLFWDEIYFNLMASMRKMRMKIPLAFTLEYFQEVIQNQISPILNYEYEIIVFQNKEEVDYFIRIIQNDLTLNQENFTIDVFKDVHIEADYISSIHFNSPKNQLAKVYAKENDLNDVIILNNELNVAHASTGNIYYFIEGNWYTNTIDQGPYRQAIDESIQKKIEVQKKSFSAFELQKAEEISIISDSNYIQPVYQFRKKKYDSREGEALLDILIQ